VRYSNVRSPSPYSLSTAELLPKLTPFRLVWTQHNGAFDHKSPSEYAKAAGHDVESDEDDDEDDGPKKGSAGKGKGAAVAKGGKKTAGTAAAATKRVRLISCIFVISSGRY
jgi:hypothetical protein